MFSKILQSKWLAGLMATVVVWLGASVYKIQSSVNQVNKEADNLKQKIGEAENSIAENDQLRENIKNESYLEQLARLRLNFKKPDENVVFVYRNRYNADAIANSQLPITNSELKWWEKIWQWTVELARSFK